MSTPNERLPVSERALQKDQRLEWRFSKKLKFYTAKIVFYS